MRVCLNGYVVNDDDAWIYELFGYTVFSPAVVRQAIKDNPEGEDLVFEINSGGGSVFAGFEIFSVLKAADIRTVAEVQSLAASAASTMMLGCDLVMLSPVAQVMVHLPSCGTYGDENAHMDSIKLLKSITKSIIAGYETKCKGKQTREQLEAMVAATSWMTAEEAVDAGLADGILYQDDDSSLLPSNVVNAVGAGIRSISSAGFGLPDANTLRAEYKSQQSPPPTANDPNDPAGRVPAEDNDGWQAKARLNIEKIRY